MISRLLNLNFVGCLVAIALVLLPADLDSVRGIVTASHAVAADMTPQGFGANTPGGSGQPEYRVTSLADSGPGTLRDAISRGNRRVVFDVGGTIQVQSTLSLAGAFITVDGMTAPAPGITLRAPSGFAVPVLQILGNSGAHDVIVRGIRIRGAASRDTDLKTSNDCMRISGGAYNVLVDRVSISGCTDGALDISDGTTSGPETRDVTVQWSILADTRKLMLVKYGTTRITLHHNLLVHSVMRMPQVNRDGLPPDPGLTLDMRNNVLYDWAGGSGTQIAWGATANVIGNLYANPNASTSDQQQALIICRGDGIATQGCEPVPEVRARAYAAGNLSLDGVNLDAKGTVGSAFAAPAVTTTSACYAAHEVTQYAGAQPRDQRDAGYVGEVVLPRCSGEEPAPVPGPAPAPAPAPGGESLPDLVTTSVNTVASVTRDTPFTIAYTLANQGTAAAPASRYAIYLSRDTRLSTDDIVLRLRDSPAQAAGQVTSHAIKESIPSSVSAGSYYVLMIADSSATVRESNESNNLLAVPITVTGENLPDLVTTSSNIPSTVTRGVPFSIGYTLANRGTAAAPASRYSIYLSRDTQLSADDVALRLRDSPSLAAGQVTTATIKDDVPSSVSAGSYYILLIADATGIVRESNESNNVLAVPITVR